MMRAWIVTACLLIAGCSGGSSPTSPSPTTPSPAPSPAPTPTGPTWPAAPTCTPSRPLPDYPIVTNAIVLTLADGSRPNPSRAGGHQTSVPGIWTLTLEWDTSEAGLQFSLSQQGTNLPSDPVLALEQARFAQTGPTTWQACWEGEPRQRYFVNIAWPTGTTHRLAMTYRYPVQQ